MLSALLLVIAGQAAMPDLMKAAAERLSGSCTGQACAQPAARSPFRLDSAGSTGLSAKDRAVRDDGSYCSVVGARQCTRKPRTVFSTDFTD